MCFLGSEAEIELADASKFILVCCNRKVNLIAEKTLQTFFRFNFY